MHPINKNFILVIFTAILLSCSDTYINPVEPPVPVNINYYGVMEVHKTGDDFAKTKIEGTTLEAGNYKIILFPQALELKSYYVKADAEGVIEVEYKLLEDFEVEAGYEGTVFGILQITNESYSMVLHVPVGYLP